MGSTFDANNFFIPGISEESKTSHYSQLKLSKHFSIPETQPWKPVNPNSTFSGGAQDYD